MLLSDPIEKEYKEIFAKVDAEVEEILAKQGVRFAIGYIHKFDALKQKILLEKYNITWKTTAEMNPGVLID